jgi:hypothetical protein
VFDRKLDARERRALLLGLVISLSALVSVYGVLPFVRHWQAREGVIAAETQRLARLRGLANAEPRLRDVVSQRVAALEAGPQRLLSGRTAALAASTLQTLLQDFADQSRVTVSRLDVAGAPDSTAGLPAIPATVSAIGDIYGITELLALIQHGPRLLEIAELSVRPNPALRGELLQLTVTIRAAWISD